MSTARQPKGSGSSYRTHADCAIRPKHRRDLAKIGSVQVSYVIVQEKYPFLTHHPGQQQTNVTLGTQVTVRVNTAVGRSRLTGLEVTRLSFGRV